MLQHFIEQGTAKITVNGIQFCDLYYSCPKAIQQQWFNSKHDGTLITVRYNPSNLSTIFIMKGNIPEEPAMALPKIGVVPDDIQKYYQQLGLAECRKTG